MSFFYTNNVLFPAGPSPVVYTALACGVASRRVKLKFQCFTAARYVAVKPGAGSGVDPHPEDWHSFSQIAGGHTEGYTTLADDVVILDCMTDDLGDIRWITSAANNWTVTRVGYWDDAEVWGAAKFSGVLPAAWTDLDLGTGTRLAWIKILSTAGAPRWEGRRDGEAVGIDPVATLPSVPLGRGVSIPSVANLIEHIQYTPGSADIYVGSSSAAWTDSSADLNNPIFSGVAPVAPTLLDLSPIVGSQRAVAVLRVQGLVLGTHGRRFVRFAPSDDPSATNYVRGNGDEWTGAPSPRGCAAAWPYVWVGGWADYAEVLTGPDGQVVWDDIYAESVQIDVVGWEPAPDENPPPCAVTIAEVNAEGRGRLVYTLEIAGIGVLSTYGYTPTDTWYTDAGYGALLPWLSWDSLPRVREEIDPLEGRLDVGSVRVVVADLGGGFTALVKSHRARLWTRLTATLAAGAATADVESTDGWPGTGELYIDREVLSYTGTTATSFTGLTRGLLGTVDSEHYADLVVTADHPIPEQPVVTDGAHFLVGRRAVLRVAPCDDEGIVGESQVVYRGRIAKGVKAGTSGWELPIDHLATVLADKAASRLPSSPVVSGYWYSGTGLLSRVSIQEFDHSGPSTAVYTATIPEGWYSAESLRAAVNDAIHSSGITAYVWVQLVDGAYHLHSIAVASTTVEVIIDAGGPLWALGFAAGSVRTQDIGGALSYDAPDPPRLLVVDWSGRDSINPAVEVARAEVFTAGLRVAPPGLPHARVESASGTTVTLTGGTYDQASSDLPPSLAYWAIEEAEDLVLQHLFALGVPGDELDLLGALKRLLYLDPAQLEPERWCAAGSVDDDWDWDEWEAALSHTPSAMGRWWDALVEEIEVREVVGPALGLLGVTPRITTEGRIGAARIETPLELLAEPVELDAEVWSLMSAREVEATLDDSPLVNAVTVQHSHRYRVEAGGEGEEWPEGDVQVYWAEALASLSRSRRLSYQVRGWQVQGTWSSPGTPRPTPEDLAYAVSDLALAAHFGVFGREAPTLWIPATWPSRQLRCGDVVLLTHELVPDTTQGEIGVSGRLGVVMGRHLDLTGREEDGLQVRLGPPSLGAGIGPCALADSWAAGSLTLSCSGWSTPLYAQAGSTDLDAFVSASETIAVVLVERDSAAPGSWPATIAIGGADVATGDVVLSANPFGADPFPAGGVYIVPEEWDSRWSGHGGYCWIADHNATPQLGAGGDTAQEWTI